MYRNIVQAGDSMYKQYERDLALAEGGDGHVVPLKKLKDVYTQRKAYMEFMPRAEDDYPNLTFSSG